MHTLDDFFCARIFRRKTVRHKKNVRFGQVKLSWVFFSSFLWQTVLWRKILEPSKIPAFQSGFPLSSTILEAIEIPGFEVISLDYHFIIIHVIQKLFGYNFYESAKKIIDFFYNLVPKILEKNCRFFILGRDQKLEGGPFRRRWTTGCRAVSAPFPILFIEL